ncbi:hypothetical protein ACFOYW_01730 [Gryllotalpicola reticulitermitis]|uniref:DUF3159 domain-containing protein n=1 Tax=Gryllotalpicola reticulitermitis TaxID=1184153 RepID=A0ABV8Q413_9MICO
MTDAPWLFVLVAAGSFQIGRGAPIEGIPFVLGAAALVADELGWLRAVDRTFGTPRAPGWVVAVAITVSAAVIGIAPEFGWVAALLVAAGGAAAIRPMWGRRPAFVVDEDGQRGIRRAAIWWAGIAIALCLWELASFFLGLPSARADWEHPALSDLVKPAIDAPFARAVLFGLWVAVGWAFARRGWSASDDVADSGEPHRSDESGAEPASGRDADADAVNGSAAS